MQSGHLRARAGKRWLFGAACLCLAAWPGLAAQAEDLAPAAPHDEAPRPAFLITPKLGLQETYTDNAGLTPTDRSSDFITSGVLDLAAVVDHGPTTADLNGRFAYDGYARNSSLSGWTLNASGLAALALIRDHLSIQATGSISDQYASTFGQSATDRSGVPGRTRVGLYFLGPRLTTRLGELFDLDATAQFGQVTYSDADHGLIAPLPSDVDIAHAALRLDTGEHLHTYQSLTTAQFDGDNQRFRSGSAIQSLYVSVAPGVRVIGRAGYERVYEPGVVDIGAPFLSAGLEFRPNASSHLSLEGGQRYHRAAWAADADIRVTDKLSLAARYAETVTPDQLYVANAFNEFAAQQASLPGPTVAGRFQLRDNLYDQTSFNKRAELRATFATAIQTLALSAQWSDRRFLVNDTHDRAASVILTLQRHLRTDLDLVASANYSHTFKSPLYGASETYGFDGTLAYRLNSTTDLRAGYRYTHGAQFFPGGEVIAENVVLVAIEKRF